MLMLILGTFVFMPILKSQWFNINITRACNIRVHRAGSQLKIIDILNMAITNEMKTKVVQYVPRITHMNHVNHITHVNHVNHVNHITHVNHFDWFSTFVRQLIGTFAAQIYSVN